ncbi:MAG: PfkB family carbohydrate kinase, partial [Candidatus Electryoneaceae bacterium]|nr:PfkB family carbohydrate kinase [Candidatus Electryoneaceae bacterium]
NDFNNLNVLIIGDVMIDAYLWGNVERISPEAPVPIVSVTKREERLGGAANVALNVKSMGANPILCSVIGNDEKGKTFTQLLKKLEMETIGIIKSKNRITTTKFRVIGNKNHMLRGDEEDSSDLSLSDIDKLVKNLRSIIKSKKIDIIILQDYDKGILTSKLIPKVIQLAADNQIPISVDPKRKNFNSYKNITLFKPNLKELKEGSNVDFNHEDIREMNQVVLKLQDTQNIKNALITLSEDGIYISAKAGKQRFIHSIPAHRRAISDVSGAGDTVISVASLCLAMNCNPFEIASISNLAGGLVCEEVGVVPVNKEKLLIEVSNLPIP